MVFVANGLCMYKQKGLSALESQKYKLQANGYVTWFSRKVGKQVSRGSTSMGWVIVSV